MLTIKYCDAANERLGRDVFAMLPTDISRHFRESAVFNLVANVDMSTVKMIFLPMLVHGNHWGLLVFNVRDCAVEYDDSFVQELSGETSKVIFENWASTLPANKLEHSTKVQSTDARSTQWLRKLRSGSGVLRERPL